MKQTLSLLFLLCCLAQINSQNLSADYIIINDTTNKFSSVEEILQLERFKNKVVYVDMWDTRCKFCIEQFAYTEELKKRFEEDSVEFLYLCARDYKTRKTNSRNHKNEELWKKLIYTNQLKGTHILMSNKCYLEGFIEKYSEIFPYNGHFGFPQYLIVDRNGNIVNYTAPRPSNKEALIKEINNLL